MVGPERKRDDVVHQQGKFQVSQRRACKASHNPAPHNVMSAAERQKRSPGRSTAPGRRPISSACKGFETLYIKPGSPWQNVYIESFNSRMRDELLNVESFGSLLEAKVLGKAWQLTERSAGSC